MKKSPARTNPNGANQYKVDPRQALFLQLYFDPKSDTFGNGVQSGMSAGFTEEYSLALFSKMPTWLSEKVNEMNRERLLQKAEQNLDEMLSLPSKTQAMGAFGPIFTKVGKGKKARKVPVMVHNASLLSLKSQNSQFVASKLGKKHYGDKAGAGVQFNFHIYDRKQLKRVAARIHNDESAGEGTRGRLLDSDKSGV